MRKRECIANLEKQFIHIVNHIGGVASTKIATSKECNNINTSSNEIPNLSILQDANTPLSMQEQARKEPQEMNEEDISKTQNPTKKVTNIMPYLGKVKREEERVQLEYLIKLLSQVQVDTPLLDLLFIPTYAKFLKDILSNNRKLNLGKHILSKVCFAMILNEFRFICFYLFH